jgi:hypothetical protein
MYHKRRLFRPAWTSHQIRQIHIPFQINTLQLNRGLAKPASPYSRVTLMCVNRLRFPGWIGGLRRRSKAPFPAPSRTDSCPLPPESKIGRRKFLPSPF